MGRRKGVEYVDIYGDKLREAIDASPYNMKTISNVIGKNGNFLAQALRHNHIGMDDLERVCMMIHENVRMFIRSNVMPPETEKELEEPVTEESTPMIPSEQADIMISILKHISFGIGKLIEAWRK